MNKAGEFLRDYFTIPVNLYRRYEDSILRYAVVIGFVIGGCLALLLGLEYLSATSFGIFTREIVLVATNILMLPITLVILYKMYDTISHYRRIMVVQSEFSSIEIISELKPVPQSPTIWSGSPGKKPVSSNEFDFRIHYDPSRYDNLAGYDAIKTMHISQSKQLLEDLERFKQEVSQYLDDLGLSDLAHESQIRREIEHFVETYRVHIENHNIFHLYLYNLPDNDLDRSYLSKVDDHLDRVMLKLAEAEQNRLRLAGLEVGTRMGFSRLKDHLTLQHTSFEETLDLLESSEVSKFIDRTNMVLVIEQLTEINGKKYNPCCIQTARNGSIYCNCGRTVKQIVDHV